jgi:hypothetical protein
MRISDLVRDYLILNIVPNYVPAITFSEERPPFISAEKIIFTKQTGRPVDAYVRQFDVEILLFGVQNANNEDLDSLFDDAELVLEYIKTNFVINEDLRMTITQDVTGPYITAQNRYFYRISVLTYSE